MKLRMGQARLQGAKKRGVSGGGAALVANAIAVGNYNRWGRGMTAVSQDYRWHKKLGRVPNDGAGWQNNTQWHWAQLCHGTAGEYTTNMATITLSDVYLEYPLGTTCTPVTFNGQNSVEIPVTASIEDIILNDAVNVEMPANAEYGLRYKVYNPNGFRHTGMQMNSGRGEGVKGSDDPDAFDNSDPSLTFGTTTWEYGPIATTATRQNRTRAAAMCSVGNSQADGGSTQDGKGNYSWVEYCADNKVSVTTMIGVPSLTTDTMQDLTEFPITWAYYESIASCFTHFLGNAGGNQLTGDSVGTLTTHVNTMMNRVRAWGSGHIKASWSHLFPQSTATGDDWSTTAAQTAGADATGRENFNTDLDDGSISLDYKPATAPSSLRDSVDSQLWKNNSGTALTNDGFHPNGDGKSDIKSNFNFDHLIQDLLAGDSNVIYRMKVRESTLAFTTDLATGDVNSIGAFEGSGNMVAASGDEPTLDLAGVGGIGSVKSDDTGTFMQYDTTIVSPEAAGEGKFIYMIGKLPSAAPASDAIFFGVGTSNGAAHPFSNVKHETDGNVDAYLQDNTANKELIGGGGGNDLAFFLAIDVTAADNVTMYLNSTTGISFVPFDNPSNSRWYKFIEMVLFQQNASTSADIDVEFSELGLYNKPLADLSFDIDDLYFYANNHASLGLT